MALERHHKKLKARLKKFNFTKDKKYEMDDEELSEDYKKTIKNLAGNDNSSLYNTKDILRKKIEIRNNNHLDILNGKIIKEIPEESFSSSDDAIIDKYNKIIFFNKETEIDASNKVGLNTKMDDEFINGDISNENLIKKLKDNLQQISPLITYDQKKNSKINRHYDKEENNIFLQRNSSFLIPRTNSYNKIYK